MKIIVMPDANGVVSFMGRINGQPLPDGAVIVEAENLDVAPATAAVVVEGTLKIVPDWRGSGPWYDQNAALADRKTPIHITEVGLDPREKPWAMQPRLLTKAEVKAAADAEARAKAEAEAKAQAEAEAAERSRIANLAVSDVQFGLACVAAGIISAEEAEAWVASGAIPSSLAAAIDTLPAEQRPVARIKAAGEKTFLRSSPFVAILGAALGQTPDQIDALFLAASSL